MVKCVSGGCLVAGVLLALLPAAGRAQGQAEVNRRIDLVLEKKEGTSLRTVDPNYVFSGGDKIRFRLKSAVDGYLYVMNRGSSGSWQQLFPRDELAQSRRVTGSKQYLVPASGTGWFQVTGPPGYDNVYFLISPVDLGKSPSGAGRQQSPSAEADAAAFATATPRCDDELFRARGECLDTHAGLKPLDKGEALPDRFSQFSGTTSRDLIVVDKAKDTSISSTEPFEGPSIYRFRIAHK
ncbi:MAG TPA: DUF4384 domain-containing protein [Bryobacteraceae bacterium]|jgi:hypothetical protein